MKVLRLVLLAALLVLPCFSTAHAGESWSEDYAASVARGKELKRLVLVDFTGSDWCKWCIKLDKEIFSTPEFKKYADANLVLVKIDFPDSIEQSEKIKAQNE